MKFSNYRFRYVDCTYTTATTPCPCDNFEWPCKKLHECELFL